MAIVKYGGGITEFRGSIGGVTFSRNSPGTFARIRKKPRYKRTNAAQRLSTNLAYYTAIWHWGLNAGQRAAWIALAAATNWTNRLGEAYSPSGLNLYVRSNVLLQLGERSRQDTAPGSADEPSPDFTLDYLISTGIRVTAVGTLTTPPVGSVLAFTSGPQRLSIQNWHNPWRLFDFSLIAAMGLPYTLLASADCVALRRYFFRFRVIRDSGMATPAFFEQQDTPAGL